MATTATRAPRRPRRPHISWSVVTGAVAAACLLAFSSSGDNIPAVVAIAALFALLLLAVLIQWKLNPSGTRLRRAFGALSLFALAYVIILGPRAIELAAGREGRFFLVDRATGEAASNVRPVRLAPAPPRNEVRNPSTEVNTFYWGVGAGEPGLSAAVTRTSSTAVEGRSSAVFDFTSSSPLRFVTMELGTQPPARVPVEPGELVFGSAFARALTPLPQRSSIELTVAYFDRGGGFVVDRKLTGPRANAVRLAHQVEGWHRLQGTDQVPSQATSAGLELIQRDADAHRRYRIAVDAAMLVPGVASPAAVVDYHGATASQARWRDAFRKATALAAAMLAAVILGFLLPVGGRIAGAVPALRIADLGTERNRRLLVAVGVVGVLAFGVEMASYGGYGGYLRRLHNVTEGMSGKWYLHALASLPAGVAVAVVARMLSSTSGRRPARLELGVAAVGVVLALSYFLKAGVAIPALCVLLFMWATGRRIGRLFLAGGLAFGVLSPFVNLVRGSGEIGLGALFTSGYWSDFLDGLNSRFFHLESLMVAVPFPDSYRPWRPAADLATSVVPRVLWAGKPTSAAADFTHSFLETGLHGATDVGVLSLPGEAWLTGGVVAIALWGLALGILLRGVHVLLTSRDLPAGSILLGCGVLTWLVFLNDGWGLASATQLMLIASAGWLIVLRRVRPA